MNIPIDMNDALYPRRLLFEIAGYKTIVSVLANCDSTTEWHDRKYEETCRDLTIAQTEYDLAMDAIRDKYIPNELRTPNHKFHIDFQDYVIVVEECDRCGA